MNQRAGDARHPHHADSGYDVARVQRIEAVPRILAAVARITGMRFAAVARVRLDRVHRAG